MGHEGDGAESSNGGIQQNASYIEDLSLTNLVPNDQPIQLANVESNKLQEHSQVPEKFFLTPKILMVKNGLRR